MHIGRHKVALEGIGCLWSSVSASLPFAIAPANTLVSCIDPVPDPGQYIVIPTLTQKKLAASSAAFYTSPALNLTTLQGRPDRPVQMANLKCKAGDIPKFLLILHGLPRNMENMLNINRQRPEPRLELAYALDETSRPMIQNSISVPQTIAILLDQHDHSIFGYLKFARSLGQNAQYYPRHGSLSGDQFRAVWALKDHADEEIKTWLKQARDLG